MNLGKIKFSILQPKECLINNNFPFINKKFNYWILLLKYIQKKICFLVFGCRILINMFSNFYNLIYLTGDVFVMKFKYCFLFYKVAFV